MPNVSVVGNQMNFISDWEQEVIIVGVPQWNPVSNYTLSGPIIFSTDNSKKALISGVEVAIISDIVETAKRLVSDAITSTFRPTYDHSSLSFSSTSIDKNVFLNGDGELVKLVVLGEQITLSNGIATVLEASENVSIE